MIPAFKLMVLVSPPSPIEIVCPAPAKFTVVAFVLIRLKPSSCDVTPVNGKVFIKRTVALDSERSTAVHLV